ncbi:sclerostin [Oryzias melastigma]|uniref:Sclerostin n=1 Tax=Oryzias melastigma TaxID=30732 RepID=A0A3B3D3D7_ORYME|nr:sclerostin [Oryzias melastigma]
MQVSAALLLCSSALLLLQGCCAAAKGWRGIRNDATELLADYGQHAGAPHEAILRAANDNNNNNNNNRNSNNTLNNRAKNGGRTANTVSYSASELSCRELRSTRYIADGSCRSAKPVRELVCSGQCLPAYLMPNSIIRGKWWRNSASDYRCVPAHSRTRRVQLQCPSGNTRTYKIRVVTSCKCKRFRPHHNQSDAKELPKAPRSKKHSRSKNSTPLTGNSY